MRLPKDFHFLFSCRQKQNTQKSVNDGVSKVTRMFLCAPIMCFIVILFYFPLVLMLHLTMLSCVLCSFVSCSRAAMQGWVDTFPVVPMASQPVSACPHLKIMPQGAGCAALLSLSLFWCIVELLYHVHRLLVVAYVDGMGGIAPVLEKASAVFPHGRWSASLLLS
jgi:uncharacterized membrane protein